MIIIDSILIDHPKLNEVYEKSKVWIAANRAFAELAASFAFNATLIAVATTPLYMPALYLAAAHLMLGALCHIALKVYRCFFKYSGTEPSQVVARASSAYMFGRAGAHIGLHESGHAFMAMSCFKKAHPAISVLPFRGGMTSYAISHGLTSFGRLLGKEKALLLIVAAGPMATTLFALVAFALAHHTEGTHPLISSFLNYEAATSLMSEVMYALTAFTASPYDLTHDFVNLWQMGGIHPLIPIALMIALPIAEIAYLRFASP